MLEANAIEETSEWRSFSESARPRNPATPPLPRRTGTRRSLHLPNHVAEACDPLAVLRSAHFSTIRRPLRQQSAPRQLTWCLCPPVQLLSSRLQDKANRADPNRVGGPSNNLLTGGGLGTGIAKSEGSFACVSCPSTTGRALRCMRWPGRQLCCHEARAICKARAAPEDLAPLAFAAYDTFRHEEAGARDKLPGPPAIVNPSAPRLPSRPRPQPLADAQPHGEPGQARATQQPPPRTTPVFSVSKPASPQALHSTLPSIVALPPHAALRPLPEPFRALMAAFSAIAEIADRLGLTSVVKDAANELYKNIGEKRMNGL